MVDLKVGHPERYDGGTARRARQDSTLPAGSRTGGFSAEERLAYVEVRVDEAGDHKSPAASITSVRVRRQVFYSDSALRPSEIPMSISWGKPRN